MRKLAYSVALFLTATSLSFAQITKLEYGINFGATGKVLDVDEDGNAYVAGILVDNEDYGSFSLFSNGERDVFVLKVSPTGTIVWAKSFGGLLDDEVFAIDADEDGNVLLAGSFNDEVDFDPGTGEEKVTANGGQADGYVLKLDTDGEYIWAAVFGGPEWDVVNGVVADGSRIFLTGYFAGEADLDPTDGDFLVTATATDAFFVRLTDDGDFDWAKTVGNGNFADGIGATVDGIGMPVFTGHFASDLDIDPGTGEEILTHTGSGNDIFIVKLDPSNGSLTWGKRIGGDGVSNAANAVYADDANNIYITGYFYGTGDFDPGPGTTILTAVNEFSDAFIAKFDASGALGWAHAIGSEGDEWGGGIYSFDGSVYVSGTFYNTIDFDPGPGKYQVTAEGADGDIFFLKLDEDAVLNFAVRIGDGAYDEGGPIVGDPDGNIYTARTFFSMPTDVDPSACVWNLDPETAPSYLLKFGTGPSPCITITTQPQPITTCQGFSTTVTFTVAATGVNLTYQWLAEEGEGEMEPIFDSGSFSGTTTPTLTVNISALPPGYTRHFQVEVSGDGSPSQASNEVLLTLAPLPEVLPASRCGQGPVTLKVKFAAGAQFKWYTDAVGGTPIAGATGISYTTPSLSATKTYYVSRDLGFCETSRVAITATIANCQPIPELAWAYSIGPNGQVIDMHIDRASGTVYVAGSFSGTGDFDPGPGTTALVGAGNSESFIAKYNTAGGLIWARNVGGPLQDVASAVTVDKDGNVLIAGYFLQTADLDPGSAVFNLNSAGSWDTYILKLNPDGNFLWAKRIGGTPTLGDIPSVIKTDAAGNVYVGGSFSGTVDMDPGAGVANVTSGGDTDGLILKLDPNGNYISATILRGPDFESVSDLTLDAAGNIYAAGFFYDNTDFDPGAGTAIETGSNDQNAFALKLNPTGGLLWHKTFHAATSRQEVTSITLDSDGNVIVGGMFAGTIDLDPGPGNNIQTATSENDFVVKLDANGNYLWAKSIPSSNIGTGFAAVEGVDVYIFGSFVNTTDMDPGTGVFNQTSAGLTDAHIVKLNKDGEFQWAIQMGGPSTDNLSDIGFDNDNNIYLGGWLSATGDYDPGTDIFNLVPASSSLAGSLLKLGPPSPVLAITTQPLSASACEGATVTFNVAATGAANIQYQWQKFDGSTFVDMTNGSGYTGVTTATLSVNTMGNVGAGKYRCLISGDGAADLTSAEVDLAIVTTLTAPTTTATSRCGSGSVTVTASGTTNGNYRWYLTPTGTAITGEVNDSYTTNLTATTTFYVSIVSGTCESTKTPVAATVNAVPAAPTTINITRCSGMPITLSASGGTAGGYRWYVVAAGSTPVSMDDSYITPALTVTATYYVSSNNAGCESTRTPLTITIQSCATNQPPVIAATTSNTGIQGTTSVNLTPLISDPDNNVDITTLKIVVQPKSGAAATINQSGQLTVDYSNTAFVGEDELTIEVCDIAGSCFRQVIKINVSGEMFVYNAVSPNGDGKNDELYLEFVDVIESTKENKVTIYNRWGDVVFSVNNYNNTTNVFRGNSNGGKELPSGTYYYKIEFSGGRETEMGYLSLKR